MNAMVNRLGLVLLFVSFYIVAEASYIVAEASDKQLLKVVPLPAKVKIGKGEFLLTSSTRVSYSSPDAAFSAEWLSKKLSSSTGYKIKVQKSNSAVIQLSINTEFVKELGLEGYQLSVKTKRITVSANTRQGLFWGVQTLLQLFPAEIESKQPLDAHWKIPTVEIVDYPRFGWRGLMLDVSRHFFTIDEVKTYIDLMAHYKFNVFHWHLSDNEGFRIEIKSHPKLTSVGAWRPYRPGAYGYRRSPWQPGEPANYGGFYTQEQIKDVVKYASDRGVTVIPEIDVPGHATAILAAYPELGCTNDTSIRVNIGGTLPPANGVKVKRENALNPAEENVYVFLDEVFGEIATLFPAAYIHAGGDEVDPYFWEKDARCQELMKKIGAQKPIELQSYFMSRVNEIIKSKGKKMIAWDDVLDGGISNDVTLMFWRDYLKAPEKIAEATRKGNDVIMTPFSKCYFDLYQGAITIEPPVYDRLLIKDVYSFNPMLEGADSTKILGGQANLWTENVQTYRHAEYMTYPRAFATTEVLWSPMGTNTNWKSFTNRMLEHFKRLDAANVNYAKSVFDAVPNFYVKDGKRYVELVSQLPDIEFYYTINETMPDNRWSDKYTQWIEIPEGAISLRIRSYLKGNQVGNLITYDPIILEALFKKFNK